MPLDGRGGRESHGSGAIQVGLSVPKPQCHPLTVDGILGAPAWMYREATMTKPRVQRPPFCSANARESIRCISTLNISGTTQLNNCSNSGYYASNSSVAIPAIGINGGTGSKYVLYPGSGSTFPYSLGVNTGILWYSVPTAAIHSWYISGNSYMTLSSTLLTINNPMIVGATTMNSTLNVISNINTSGLSVFSMNSNINNLQATSTTTLHGFCKSFRRL